ncbi:hypothetical protein M758_7G185900 [Ceratodon purpureus]|nr:hypothetical protein M758_7G185900 [Ceratodon purpureus]
MSRSRSSDKSLKEGRKGLKEGRKEGFEGRKEGFEGRKEGFEGRKEGFEGRKEGFEGRKEGFEGRKEGFEGRKEGFEGRKEGFEGRKKEGNKHFRVKLLTGREEGIVTDRQDTPGIVTPTTHTHTLSLALSLSLSLSAFPSDHSFTYQAHSSLSCQCQCHQRIDCLPTFLTHSPFISFHCHQAQPQAQAHSPHHPPPTQAPRSTLQPPASSLQPPGFAKTGCLLTKAAHSFHGLDHSFREGRGEERRGWPLGTTTSTSTSTSTSTGLDWIRGSNHPVRICFTNCVSSPGQGHAQPPFPWGLGRLAPGHVTHCIRCIRLRS